MASTLERARLGMLKSLTFAISTRKGSLMESMEMESPLSSRNKTNGSLQRVKMDPSRFLTSKHRDIKGSSKMEVSWFTVRCSIPTKLKSYLATKMEKSRSGIYSSREPEASGRSRSKWYQLRPLKYRRTLNAWSWATQPETSLCGNLKARRSSPRTQATTRPLKLTTDQLTTSTQSKTRLLTTTSTS